MTRTPPAERHALPRRRLLVLAAGLGAGLGTGMLAPAARAASATAFGVRPDAAGDQSRALQKAIDATSASGDELYLPPGTYRAGNLVARARLKLRGVPGATRLVATGGETLIAGPGAVGLALSGITLEGGGLAVDGASDVAIRDCIFLRAPARAVSLAGVSGAVEGCTMSGAGDAGIFALDSRGLRIAANTVRDTANNAIQVWRSAPGEDGTLVTGNRIDGVAARAGGTGQNGNGINVFRAGNVIVANNRIARCAFSAVRGNAASNFQVLGNSCSALGEVAIYAEFAFQGAVIADNIVDGAATGIAVTNFNDGGRLAVVQGNLIRAIRGTPADPDGIGIAVEADAAISGNVIESVAGIGIRLGFGPYQRDLAVTGNVVRSAHIGIGVSLVEGAGRALLADNLVTGASRGAIVAMAWQEVTGPLLGEDARVDPRVTLHGNRVD